MKEGKGGNAALLVMGLSVALLGTSCGGGSSSSSSPPPPPPPPPSPAALTSLDPIVAMQNSAAFTLTANGSNFTSASQVVFNGAGQPTTFVSANELTAQIPPSSVSQAGTFPVTVQTGSATTSSLNFYIVPIINMHPVSVTLGQPPTSPVNIAVRGFTPVLSLIAVGIGSSAGSTGVSVGRGGSSSLLLVGKGILPGTFVAISGNPNDVTVTQPVASDFGMTTDNNPAVNVNVSVSPSAAAGPRDILVTNPAGEIAAFVGGLLIR